MKQIPDLYFKLTGDDRENPTFQFNLEKVLDYSNELENGKIKYLKTIRKRYYDHLFEKFKKHVNIPKPGEEIKSDHQSIIESEFYMEIIKRIELLIKCGENVKIDSNYNTVLKRFAEYEDKYNKEKQKEFTLTFDILEIKKNLQIIHSENDKVLYLNYLKKEFEEMLYYPNSNQINIIKENKLEKDCQYSENGVTKGKGSLTFNELLINNLIPFVENSLKKLNPNSVNEFKLHLEKLKGEKNKSSPSYENDTISSNKNDSKVENNTILNPASINFNWKGNKASLKYFIELIEVSRLIPFSKIKDKSIYYHFNILNNEDNVINKNLKNIKIKKIVWIGNKQDLVYLFNSIEKMGLLCFQKNKNMILDSHFCLSKDNGKTVSDFGSENIKSFRSKINSPTSTIIPDERIYNILSYLKDKMLKKQ